jgi:hypothetical protein
MMFMAAEAAEAADNTGAWFALGGVALTGFLGLMAPFLQERWARNQSVQDFDKQLRQERRELYLQYWDAWNALEDQVNALIAQGSPAYAVLPPTDLASAHPGAEPYEVVDDDEWLVRGGTPTAARHAELLWRQASEKAMLSSGKAVMDALIEFGDLTQQRVQAAWKGRVPDSVDELRRRVRDSMRDEIQTAPDIKGRQRYPFPEV